MVVGHEARRGEEHLVAVVDQGQHAEHDGFLRAGGDDDLLGGVVEAVLALELAGDRRAEWGDAGRVGVVVLVVGDRLLGGRDDVGGRVEVGVAAAHRYDVVEPGRHLQEAGAEADLLGDDAVRLVAQEGGAFTGHRHTIRFPSTKVMRTFVSA